jgi:hypothetical protein
VARFSVSAPSGHSWCRASANQRLLTTGSAVRRQLGTQLVGARWSFVCQQNCSRSRAPLLRSRLPLDDALNAFGLFAGVRYRFLLDKAIAMLMLRRWGSSNIESPCGSATRTWLTSPPTTNSAAVTLLL